MAWVKINPMLHKLKIRAIFTILAIWVNTFSSSVVAQFIVGGQLLSRTEYRNGYGKLIGENQKPYFGIGQRARIHFQYYHEKIKFYSSVQDVRTWGSTSQANISDNLFSVHEAYAEILLGKLWLLKAGRQELNYDNVRFLGNLDWALQARSHDFALVKFERDQMKLHIGAGYNQAKEALAQEPYTISNQYKTAQLLRYENKLGPVEVSFLFWNNGLEQDNLGNLKIRFSQTVGFPIIKYSADNFIFSGFYYHQLGRDVVNNKINAHDASLQASHKIYLNEEKGQQIQTTLGFEWLSGTSQQANDNVNRSFNPFYGTNHAHNGYMDFFYVGGRYVNSIGLQDYFLRFRFDPSQKLFLSLNTHQFLTAENAYANNVKLSKTLGTEFDFTIGFIANEVVSLQGGYAQLFASKTFETISGQGNAASLQNWVYVALLVRPNMKNRFVGLLF